jgi:hypothetical protein
MLKERFGRADLAKPPAEQQALSPSATPGNNLPPFRRSE